MRVVANLAVADIRSSTGSNVFNLGKDAKMSLNIENLWDVRLKLLDLKTHVHSKDSWSLGCLRKFLTEKYALREAAKNTLRGLGP